MTWGWYIQGWNIMYIPPIILVHPFLIAVLSSWRSISSGSTCVRQGFPQPSALGLKCGETIINSINPCELPWKRRTWHGMRHARCWCDSDFGMSRLLNANRIAVFIFFVAPEKSFKAMYDRKTRKIANKPVIQKGFQMRRFRASLTSNYMVSSNNQKSIAVLRLL